MNNQVLPIRQVWLNRIFVGMIVFLAILAGYFYTELQQAKKEYARLENTKLELMDISGGP